MAEKTTTTPTPEAIADKSARELIGNHKAMSYAMLGASSATKTEKPQK